MSPVRTRGLAVALLAVALVAIQPVAAQSPDGRRRGFQDRDRLEQRVREQMGRIMRERLDLTEAEGERLSEVVAPFEQRRRDLFREEQDVRREVERMAESNVADAQAASDLLARMADVKQREATLFVEEQAALLEVLTPSQVVELHALREQIGRRIRALRGGRRDGDGRRRGRGGADGRRGAPER